MTAKTENQTGSQKALPDLTDKELLKCYAAADALLRHPAGAPDAAEWARNPVPAAPLGHVKFEVARQIATFAAPVLVMLAAGAVWGQAGALLGLPVAVLLGYGLDRQLTKAISRKAAQENTNDRSRYLTVNFIAERFNCPVEQVTLRKIQSMAKIYRSYAAGVAERDAEFAARRAALEARGMYRNPKFSKGGTAAVAVGAVGVLGAAGAAAAMSQPDDFQSAMPLMQVNPANGMPMLEGTMLDVGGNVYGTDNAFDIMPEPQADFSFATDTSADMGMSNSFGNDSFSSSNGFGSDNGF